MKSINLIPFCPYGILSAMSNVLKSAAKQVLVTSRYDLASFPGSITTEKLFVPNTLYSSPHLAAEPVTTLGKLNSCDTVYFSVLVPVPVPDSLYVLTSLI